MEQAANPRVPRKRVRRDDRQAQDELRSAAIEAALALYSAHGSAALTMRAVADAVGVSPMALYHYFANKAELLAALGEFALAELLQVSEQAIAAHAEPLARIRASTEAFIDYWERHPEHYRLVYVDAVGNPGDARRLGDSAVYRRMLQVSTALFEALAAELGAGSERVAMARDLRLAMVLGYLQASLMIRRYPWSDLPALRACVIETTLSACTACLRGG